MTGRTLLAVLLFLGAAFTGCLSKGDDTPLETQDEGDNATLNDIPPDGRSGRLIAFEETNETEEGLEGLDHHHDYWMGRERVTLFETPTMMEPGPDDANRAFTVFPVPQPGLVFEATGKVEFTISNPERHACVPGFTLGDEDDYLCHDRLGGLEVGGPPVPDATGGPAGLLLRYKHSATDTWIEVGVLTWGQPLEIKIKDPRETDMPHATASLWTFQIVSPNPHDVTLKFTAKAEIVRSTATDIPLWPGHPVFYTESNHHRTVLDRSVTSGDEGLGAKILPEDAGPAKAEKLISYGTRTLYVWANITSVDADPVFGPSHWYLRFRNATGHLNTTNFFDDAHTVAVKDHFWVLSVDDNGMDSPYADGSRWEFEIYGAYTTPDPTGALPQFSCYGGCASYVVKYDLKVIASDILEPDLYSTYSL